jgi:hypothetical protein
LFAQKAIVRKGNREWSLTIFECYSLQYVNFSDRKGKKKINSLCFKNITLMRLP